MKPVLVGESNPYGDDPEMALFPSPEKSSGHRLCALIFGMFAKDYLENFNRVNLCRGIWDNDEAVMAASLVQGEKVVLLGSRVCKAFGVKFAPFTRTVLRYSPPRVALILPHPSGLSRLWNEQGAVIRAREELVKLCPSLADLVGRV